MVCVTGPGSDYSPGSPTHTVEFQEPYLRAVFAFIGITDLAFVNVQPHDISARRAAALEAATAEVLGTAADPAQPSAWHGNPGERAADTPDTARRRGADSKETRDRPRQVKGES